MEYVISVGVQLPSGKLKPSSLATASAKTVASWAEPS